MNCTDTDFEKSNINEHAFSHLRSYCQSLGLHFYGVDLYDSIPLEGIPPLATEDGALDYIYELEQREIFRLAASEVKLCQTESSGPAFVVT